MILFEILTVSALAATLTVCVLSGKNDESEEAA